MNTYIISAESYHIINDELKKIIKDNIPLYFNMYKTTIKDVITEANYYSLDNEKKYIIVSNADFFGTSKNDNNELDIIDKYLDNYNPNTVIIFTTLNGADLRKKTVKRIKDDNKLINIPKLDKKGIINLINKYLGQFDNRIDYQTINYIIDNSYNNLDIIYNELDKIILYYNKKCTINYNDVVRIIGKEIDSNSFHFISSIISKDLNESLKIYNELKVYKIEPTSLIVLLAREYRLMYYTKLLNKKMNKEEICNYLNIRDWQLTKLYTNSLKYSEVELLDNLKELCIIDMNIKKGIYDKDIILYNFMLNVCN